MKKAVPLSIAFLYIMFKKYVYKMKIFKTNVDKLKKFKNVVDNTKTF